MTKTSHVNSGNPKKFELTPAKFIIGTLVILFAIIGCSDMPYTGSNLTVLEVNRYLVSTDGESLCFQDGLERTCIRLGPETGNPADGTNGPAVYIYPERRVYTFYYQGNPILQAERAQIKPPYTRGGDPQRPDGGDDNGDGDGNGGDDNGGDDNGDDDNGDDDNGDDDNGDDGGDGDDGDDNGDNGDDGDDGDSNPPNNNDDGHGWIIWVYYPEDAAPKNAPTLSESGVTVTLNGKQLTDEDIIGFAQFIGSEGERGIQFFYPTESAELLNLKIQIEGVDSDDETVRFNINYLWNAQ